MHRYYKPYKDSTLMRMSKKDLISQIRRLEHNWGVAEEGGDNVLKLLEEISENVPGVNRYLVVRVLGEEEYDRLQNTSS